MYMISACLLGENCKYSGDNNYCQWVVDFAEKHSHIAVCPEVRAGLPAPRPPAEIVGDKVLSQEGDDWTEIFMAGAILVYEEAAAAAQQAGEEIQGAILKAKSPSCGCGEIYDGTFSHTIIRGDGYLTRLLKDKNINVRTEKEKMEND